MMFIVDNTQLLLIPTVGLTKVEGTIRLCFAWLTYFVSFTIWE